MDPREGDPDSERLGERPDFGEWAGDVMSALEARREGESLAPTGRLGRYRLLVVGAARRLIRRRTPASS